MFISHKLCLYSFSLVYNIPSGIGIVSNDIEKTKLHIPGNKKIRFHVGRNIYWQSIPSG